MTCWVLSTHWKKTKERYSVIDHYFKAMYKSHIASLAICRDLFSDAIEQKKVKVRLRTELEVWKNPNKSTVLCFGLWWGERRTLRLRMLIAGSWSLEPWHLRSPKILRTFRNVSLFPVKRLAFYPCLEMMHIPLLARQHIPPSDYNPTSVLCMKTLS